MENRRICEGLPNSRVPDLSRMHPFSKVAHFLGYPPLARYGQAWAAVAGHGLACMHGMARQSPAWTGIARHGPAWRHAWHGMAELAQHGRAWSGIAGHDRMAGLAPHGQAFNVGGPRYLGNPCLEEKYVIPIPSVLGKRWIRSKLLFITRQYNSLFSS